MNLQTFILLLLFYIWQMQTKIYFRYLFQKNILLGSKNIL